MKVNMTPNPLDVVTIHASQGDTEARQWEFELHNNGELIDTSDVTEQLFFKAYKGGTEQLLPENGSTPTTSPFKGDIKYPQGLLADQEFTYRQSPTESDGLAKITDIKGNTLVWNQQVDISVVPSSSVINGITYSRQTGEIKATGTASSDSTLFISGSNYNIYNFINGHAYYLRGCPSGGSSSTYYVSWSLAGRDEGNGKISIATSNITGYVYARIVSGVTVNNLSFKPQLFDLTAMGLDITDPSDFTSLFPLPYYDYNAGALLSFNGTGLKTTGKNQLNPSAFDYDTAYEYSDDGNLTVKVSDPRAWTAVNTFHLKKGNYIFTRSVANGTCDIRFGYENFATSHLIANQVASYSFTVAQDTDVKIKVGYSYSSYPFTTNVMIRFADTDSTFEPYTSSTLSLPVSTYFPTGMKSAGTAYDELTPTKAITRIGVADLGTLNWNYNSTSAYFTTNEISSLYKVPSSNLTVANIIGSKHTTISANDLVSGGQLGIAIRSNGTLMVKDTNYTDATAFKQAMSGVYLYYELATETETSFTTASLVTENAEIPLSNEDGTLIGKCTEELSENPGFIDAKIKLSDSDGECYSNKIQLHVERSPQ